VLTPLVTRFVTRASLGLVCVLLAYPFRARPSVPEAALGVRRPALGVRRTNERY
jgi:hypothetical protein